MEGKSLFQNDFYDAIYKAKSVRKYSNEEISNERLEKILVFADKMTPLFNNIQTSFKMLKPSQVKSFFPLYSPQYICFYSSKIEGYLENAGYMMQQMYLYFVSKNIGACWITSARPVKELLYNDELDYVAMMAFGTPDEENHRKSINEFNRKPLKSIRNFDENEKIFEAARLAPSGHNAQPWYFTRSNKGYAAHAKTGFSLYKKLLGLKYEIDIGIALCNITVAAKEFNKNVKFYINEKDIVSKQGYEYIISFRIV